MLSPYQPERVFGVSNYRVRQVLGLGRMPERQRTLLVALATWMNDDTRVVTVAYSELVKNTGQAPNTVKAARRELEAAGKLASDPGGKFKGNRTVWAVLCLPETAGMGVNIADPHTAESKGVNIADPLATAGKGVNGTDVRGSNGARIGGQPQLADQREPDRGFNPQAKTSGSISLSAPASVAVDDDDERENDDFGEEQLDPDHVLLAEAVPGADELDVEWAITTLQIRKHHSEIRTTVRAYLRKVIANGDAQALVDDAAAERRRAKTIPAADGPFDTRTGGDGFFNSRGEPIDPQASAAPLAGPVVAGEVIQPDTGVPGTRVPAPPAYESPAPGWQQVECPVCKVGPGRFCCRPGTIDVTATHAARHEAAR